MKQIGIIQGAILFTDIKNFTLKSSLLTQKQINELLNNQNKIIFPIIKKYFGKIIKSLGDSYMIVFEKAENVIKTGIEIQEKLLDYNSNIKFDLYKIELRITADYGYLNRKSTIKGEDYFGTPVNTSSRLQSITPENKFFITGNLYENIKNNENIFSNYLGNTTFKGILSKVDIYEILYNTNNVSTKNISINNKSNKNKKINDVFITNNMKNHIKNVDNTIIKFSSVVAILGIQPIPFLDIYGLLPLHLYLLSQISKEYGIKLSKNESKEIFSTIMSSIGGSYLLSKGIIGISKIGFLGLGGYIMMPLNFALTYSIGKILSYYLYKKSQGIKSTNEELKTLFKYSVISGKEIAKKDKKEILSLGKKYKDVFKQIISK